MRKKPSRESCIFRLFFAGILVLIASASVRTAEAEGVRTPNFVDQRQKIAKPALGERERIRFLTTTDYPPFNFLDPRGKLVGFNVDLVKDICAELGVLAKCQIQAVAFKDLVPTLKAGQGDAIVAGLAMTPANRRDLTFSQPYLRYPARFVTLKSKALAEPITDYLDGKLVGVVQGSAHKAMFEAFFPGVRVKSYTSQAEGLTALRDHQIDAWFGDGVSLSFWLQGETASDCCVFSGGPFFSDRFLGEGLAIAVPPKDGDLARAIDYALSRIVAKGEFSDLMLEYFPVSAY